MLLLMSRSILTLTCLAIALLGIAIRCRASSLPMTQKVADARQAEIISSDDELAKVMADLNHSEMRMQALARLIRFSSYKIYQVGSVFTINGDQRIDALQERAARAVRDQINIETVEAAIDSADPTLQFWGVFFFRVEPHSQAGDSNSSNSWMSLLPKIKKLAVDGDENIRSIAIDRLISISGNSEFLADRVKVETSPSILMRLVYHPDRAEFSRRLNSLLLKLLNNTDEEVRRRTLVFIATNYLSAPMWQIEFDRSIFDKTLERVISASREERAAAVQGLVAIRNLDLNQSREVLIRLASDESETVRSRIASGLKEQFQRKDVKAVIADLLKDPSPLVQYMTILEVGPEHCLEELKVLTQSSDSRVSMWASKKLEQLADPKKSQ